MSVAADTARHKRGFDSLTSHTFFMSKAKYGKKVVKYVVRHRTCGTCQWWRRNRPQMPVRKHRCVFNHTGSARLMECKGGVQGVKKLFKEGTPVEIIEGDGNNTMLAHIKTDLDITLQKRFDRNHVVKNITKKLFAVKKLSKSVVMHLQKCVKYAFAKNQGDAKGLEENLRAIVPHQFGDHKFCDARFCGFKRSPDQTYSHKSLPYKAALKDNDLRLKLDEIFSTIIANAEQFSELGSSQQCEHANREVSLRVPKSLHYGNSEALDFRVAATTAFINEGREYIAQVNKELGISPGKYTEAYADVTMKRRKYIQEKSKLPSKKRRRLILKQERLITKGANEALEGASYQSEVAHDVDADVQQLPEAVPRGDFKAVPATDASTFVAFDLETTDLIRGGRMPHITQIAAKTINGNDDFSTYVIPKIPMSSSAQDITGIVYNNSGKMTVYGQEVTPMNLNSAVSEFCDWLSKQSHVYLVAHNGRKFDFPVFLSALSNVNSVPKFMKCVSELVDSLAVFKKSYPGLSSYKQEELAKSILGASYGAHNAQEDVKMLSELIVQTNMGEKELSSLSFPPSAVHHQLLYNKEKAANISSLHPLMAKGVFKVTIAEKIAGSGLNLSHLRKIYERDGEDGLYNIFMCKNSEGQPRVTSAKKTLEEVIPKLAQVFK